MSWNPLFCCAEFPQLVFIIILYDICWFIYSYRTYKMNKLDPNRHHASRHFPSKNAYNIKFDTQTIPSYIIFNDSIIKFCIMLLHWGTVLLHLYWISQVEQDEINTEFQNSFLSYNGDMSKYFTDVHSTIPVVSHINLVIYNSYHLYNLGAKYSGMHT